MIVKGKPSQLEAYMALVEKDEMTTLRTASDSKATAANSLDDIQTKAVAYAINSAANCGEYTTIFQEVIRPNVKSELLEKGYVLTPAPELNKGTIISWK